MSGDCAGDGVANGDVSILTSTCAQVLSKSKVSETGSECCIHPAHTAAAQNVNVLNVVFATFATVGLFLQPKG